MFWNVSRTVLVAMAAVLGSAMMVLAMAWLRLVDAPVRGVAPDVVTPLLLGPIAVVLAAWVAALVSHQRPGQTGEVRAGAWHWAPAALLFFGLGGMVFGLPAWRGCAADRRAGVMTLGQAATVTVTTGFVGGLATMNLLMIPYAALRLVRRGGRAEARSE